MRVGRFSGVIEVNKEAVLSPRLELAKIAEFFEHVSNGVHGARNIFGGVLQTAINDLQR